MSRAAALVTTVVATAVATLGAACGAPRPPAPGGVERDDAIVQLQSNVRDAQVFVDGRFLAPLSAVRAGIAVEPGYHRFELRREGYFSRYLELELARAERRRVELEMAPVLP